MGTVEVLSIYGWIYKEISNWTVLNYVASLREKKQGEKADAVLCLPNAQINFWEERFGGNSNYRGTARK